MPEHWFEVRAGTPWWRRKIVDMHTRGAGDCVLVEVVDRYWSARRAAGLARLLNDLNQIGGRL